MTDRIQRIDDLVRGDHPHLSADDKCYFLYEYTSGKNFEYGKTNSLISNLKKKPSLRGTAQYRYKESAIRDCGAALGRGIRPGWLERATLVPIPPSKARSDPDYDDRMLQICKAIPFSKQLDIRELVNQRESLPAAHEVQQRPTIQDLVAVYEIDEAMADPAPQVIGVIDDVLTAGTHYCAMKQVLSARFPGVAIVGVFIARRVFPTAPEATTDFQ